MLILLNVLNFLCCVTGHLSLWCWLDYDAVLILTDAERSSIIVTLTPPVSSSHSITKPGPPYYEQLSGNIFYSHPCFCMAKGQGHYWYELTVSTSMLLNALLRIFHIKWEFLRSIQQWGIWIWLLWFYE